MKDTLLRLFTKSATVSEARTLDDRFRLVTLSGESLRGVRWAPGQKAQMSVDGWVFRTFTPLSWDPVQGSTQLLLFLHGESPAARWGRALKVGDSCTMFGPRDSLDLNTLDRPALLFGDETSFALAHALRFTPPGAEGVRVVLEVTSRQAAKDILEHLGIANADLIERRPNDAHLSDVEQVAVDHLQAHSIQSCALSGKASSIQRLSKRLRALGLSGSQVRTRAYWAPGKVGLD
jgi:ferric-chelate reductase (NADPH)